MFLSVISLHDLEHGVLLVERSDPTKGAILRTWLDSSVNPAFQDRLLPVNAEIARQTTAPPAQRTERLCGAVGCLRYLIRR